MTTPTAAASTDIIVDSEALFQSLVDRRRFSKAVQTWGRYVHTISAWESSHLLIDNPSANDLAMHRKAVERLLHFGQVLGFIASCSEFDDVKSAEMVLATQIVLKDKFRLWHSPKPEREKSHSHKETPPKSTGE